MFKVARTDCRTAWQVVTASGRPVPYCTFRRREAAVEAAAEMNKS